MPTFPRIRNAFLSALLVGIVVIVQLKTVEPAAASVSLNLGFGATGVVRTVNNAGDFHDLAVQPDGKILVGGWNSSPGYAAAAVSRYQVEGLVDQTFANSGVFTLTAPYPTSADAGIVVQADGKIVFAGEGAVTAAGGEGDRLLIGRLDSLGNLDPAYGAGGSTESTLFGANVNAHALMLQPDEKAIVVGGAGPGLDHAWFVARYTTAGGLDPTFGSGGVVTLHPAGTGYGEAISVVMQPDQRIVVAGQFDGHPVIARYHLDGSPDQGFGIGGLVVENLVGHATGVTVQPSGKLVVSYNLGMSAIRYNPDGSRDTSFGVDGISMFTFSSNDSAAYAITQFHDQIVLAGFLSSGAGRDFILTALNDDGSLDTTFGAGGLILTDIGSTSDVVTQLIVQGDLLTAGGVSGDYDTPYIVAQYHEDGSPARQLTSLTPAQIWVGLKTSDDVGIKFDLRGEIYRDDTLISVGEITSFPGGSSGFNNAHLATIAFNSFAPINFPLGSQLQLRLLVRNSCSGSGKNSGTVRIWYNDSSANSKFGAVINTQADYYLRDGLQLATTAGSGPRRTLDAAAGARCSAFKPAATWAMTI